MLTVGTKFPEFKCHANVGPNAESLTLITNESAKGKWSVFVFYPKDFTFICPTELVDFNKRLADFADRDAVVYGASTDNEYSHLAWCQQHTDLRNLKYPLLAAQKLSSDLWILDPNENVCLRATYVVDPNGIIQWASANALSVGRSTEEVLRVLDALQSDELCPCNWKKGEATIKV
ncbi:MAG: peroxiredoxin [Planctomycetia bacterium]|nr:peroxiredoxin [Planctomycetia bacterium]